jgi:lambda family phage tail tape measure protein
MAEFAQVLIRAKDETKSAFDSASRNMRGLQSDASRLNGMLGALGVGVSVAGLAAFAKSGIDAADAMNDMSQRLGVSVKDLASFKLAAEQSGTSLDGVGAGIARLSRSIGEAENGNKKLAGTLKELGITARDPKEAFFQLADAVQSIEDPNKRAALLSQVLGKSYGELVPLLNQGSEALRESAKASETFAESMAKLAPDADKFNDQLELLKTNTAGFAASILSSAVPALNTLFERISTLKDLVGAGGFINSLGLSGTAKIDLPKVQKDIASTVAELERLKKRPDLNEPFIAPLQQQLKSLTRMRDILIKAEVGRIQGIAPRAAATALGDTDFSKALSSGSKKKTATDPLASLLGSTDIAKLAEFDKTVAQLNARFDGGRKNTELYTQAMTKLVETTFSANFTEFNKQLAEQDETQRLTAEHLKATNDALYVQQQAWADAGAALTDEMRTPLENANIEFGRLQDMLDRGVISWETYARAVMKTQDAIEDAPKKLEGMDTFAKKFAENAQDTFADFFKNFDQGTDGMLKKFGETVKSLIAEAASAQLTRALFGGLSDGGKTSGSGWIGGALEMIGGLFASANGNAFANGAGLSAYSGSIVSSPTVFPFAKGAGLMGEAGPEVILPLKRGSDGKLGVSSGSGGGGPNIVQNFYGYNNAPEVRRAGGQGAREALGMMSSAKRYA